MVTSSIDYTLIGSRIQKKRKELNLTQEQLSEKLNLTSFYLSKIENGRAAATLETFASIAHHLEMDLAMLLTGTSILEKQYHIDKLNSICAKATNKQLDLIIKLAKVVLED